MSRTENVSASQPKIGGAVWRAPMGTTLPTDAKTNLDQAFASLGYISEEGLTNGNSPETEAIKSWGGDVVMTPQTGKSDTFRFKMLEALNPEVLKSVYGSDNVTGTLEEGLTVVANSTPPEDCCWVIETIMRGNILKRTVIPKASLVELGEIVYKDGEPVGYETTISAKPDAAGNTHYEYMVGE